MHVRQVQSRLWIGVVGTEALDPIPPARYNPPWHNPPLT